MAGVFLFASLNPSANPIFTAVAGIGKLLGVCLALVGSILVMRGRSR
jgi:hypothetical protein